MNQSSLAPSNGMALQPSASFYLTMASLVSSINSNSMEQSPKGNKQVAMNAFYCGFENGWCPGWKTQGGNSLQWALGQGPTKTTRTGPNVDHTLKSHEGHYVYMEASGSRFGMKAILRSPLVDMNEYPKYCLRFWYHMYGRGMGSLKVLWSPPKKVGRARSTVFLLSTQTGSSSKNETDWLFEDVTLISPKLFNYKRPVYFEFQATRGPSPRSDIAIDDVSLLPGSCNEGLATLFNDFQKTTKGLEGTTTGQVAQPTTKSQVHSTTETAQTQETTQNQTTDPTVSVQQESTPSEKLVQEATTTNGPENTKAQQIEVTTKPQMVVTDKPSMPETTTTSQNNIFQCDFEDGWCPGWRYLRPGRREWTVAMGHTKSKKTGPSIDHTRKTKSGTYVYFEASGISFGSKSIFRTPSVDMNEHPKYCFRFWYHMYGSGMGNLKVIWSPPKKVGNARPSVFQIATISGSASKNETDWLLKEVELIAPITFNYRKPVYFKFQATRGTSVRSDIAVDDVSLVVGTCKESAATPEGTTPTPLMETTKMAQEPTMTSSISQKQPTTIPLNDNQTSHESVTSSLESSTMAVTKMTEPDLEITSEVSESNEPMFTDETITSSSEGAETVTAITTQPETMTEEVSTMTQKVTTKPRVSSTTPDESAASTQEETATKSQETTPINQPETKPSIQPETVQSSQPETKPTSQPETEPSTQTETNQSTQPETKPSIQPETTKSTEKPPTPSASSAAPTTVLTTEVSKQMCGKKYIYGKKQICCSGVVRQAKRGEKCCGKRTYNPRKSRGCCGQRVIWLRMHGCCNGKKYVMYFFGCCDGELYNRRRYKCVNGCIIDKFW